MGKINLEQLKLYRLFSSQSSTFFFPSMIFPNPFRRFKIIISDQSLCSI